MLDIHPRFDILTWDPIDISLEGQYIKNLAYNRNAILDHGPPNSLLAPGPVNNLGNNGVYQGGDTGYMAKITLGQLEIAKLWDWNTFLTYRYLETDATPDAIADARFPPWGHQRTGLHPRRQPWHRQEYLAAAAILQFADDLRPAIRRQPGLARPELEVLTHV